MSRNKALSFLTLLSCLLATSAFASTEIVGAGASLPHAIYTKWGSDLGNNLRLTYFPVGSGGGIELLKNRKADFGASDRPLSKADLDKHDLLQFPAVIGAIVPVVNIQGVAPGQLKLDGDVLAKIYMGKITKWNDAAIMALNKGLDLPAATIAPLHRSDSSGSSFLFTHYLSAVNAEWRKTLGTGTKIEWQVGTGALGGNGMVNYLRRLPNSIAYIDYSEALKEKLAYVQMKTAAGNFVSPGLDNIEAAAANAQWKAENGFYEILTNQPGESWPITGASFVLLHKSQRLPSVAEAILTLYDWGFNSGKNAAKSLGFVTLPDSATNLIRAEWKAQLKNMQGQPVWR